MKLMLQVSRAPEDEPAVRVFHTSRVVVGRNSRCDLPLEDASHRRLVSHRHLQFDLTPEALRVRDLGSTNGTYVNGEPVAEGTLRAGDVVRLGQSGPRLEVVDFELPAPVQERRPSAPLADPAGQGVAVVSRRPMIEARPAPLVAPRARDGEAARHGPSPAPPHASRRISRREALALAAVGLPGVAALGGAAWRWAAGNAGAVGDRVFRRLLSSTVLLYDPDTQQAVGAGFVIDRQRRLVVTCLHVAGAAPELYAFAPLFQDGRLVTEKQEYLYTDYYDQRALVGQAIATDSRRDLVVLRMDELWPQAEELRLAARRAAPGRRVHLLGNPPDASHLWKFATGHVRQVARERWEISPPRLKLSLKLDADIVQTDAAIGVGGSGGPLVDDSGHVLGISHAFGPAGAKDAFIDAAEIGRLLDRLKT